MRGLRLMASRDQLAEPQPRDYHWEDGKLSPNTRFALHKPFLPIALGKRMTLGASTEPCLPRVLPTGTPGTRPGSCQPKSYGLTPGARPPFPNTLLPHSHRA